MLNIIGFPRLLSAIVGPSMATRDDLTIHLPVVQKRQPDQAAIGESLRQSSKGGWVMPSNQAVHETLSIVYHRQELSTERLDQRVRCFGDCGNCFLQKLR